MRDARLFLKQVWFETLSFLRNPTAAIFTLLFPILFLVLGGIDDKRSVYQGQNLRNIVLIVPGIIAYGIFSANFTNLAMRITVLRDQGVLKRVRGTPVPTWMYLAGHIGTSVVISTTLALIISVAGRVFYHVTFPWEGFVPMVLALIVSSFAFSSMALAISGMIRNADSAPAVVQVFALPQFIFGGVFFTITDSGFWGRLARALPLSHLSTAVKQAYGLGPTNSYLAGHDLFVLALWGVAGVFVAVRRFKWENPMGVSHSSRKSRRSPAPTSSQ